MPEVERSPVAPGPGLVAPSPVSTPPAKSPASPWPAAPAKSGPSASDQSSQAVGELRRVMGDTCQAATDLAGNLGAALRSMNQAGSEASPAGVAPFYVRPTVDGIAVAGHTPVLAPQTALEICGNYSQQFLNLLHTFRQRIGNVETAFGKALADLAAANDPSLLARELEVRRDELNKQIAGLQRQAESALPTAGTAESFAGVGDAAAVGI